tara:strand:+ start:568 stop:1128 length:561 start_codon:yes stop_codon:yes gene_type:complete
MEDNNIIFKNKWTYNKFIDINKDTNDKLKKTKLQFVNKDSMFTHIKSINNLSSIIGYDDLKSDITHKSINSYYQQYPNINLDEKTFLSEIYEINNLEELNKWLLNNKTKNLKTIHRILNLSFIVFNKDIFIELDYYKLFLYELYIYNFKSLSENNIKNAIDRSLKEFNIKKNKYISEIIIDNISKI